MEPKENNYSDIDYKKGNVMEQITKYFKNTDENILEDIVHSIESITNSMESIQENHLVFLKINKALALYVVEIEEERNKNIHKELVTVESLEKNLRKPQLETIESSEDKV
ncbi:hypothetical protein M0802_008197 [Mischocyttarus mexicanus]|nr:hypothetical protein M0802_008197 [Mischocyttarus mexicanus]